ncbi:MurR/RpiR family transcriptional regulator [Romboutsia weinsteinii]|uniref:MurR/RpiR family transcriptional regulator n=1 Tax=Romboutsia weinsteinii TaxID=2020949 RepID=A0A371J7G2_9FIRM|nr:MurR/RpiR family transcriptional regulator [Romboutsia weinsteinii]
MQDTYKFKIQSTYFSLRPSEQKVAEFVLKNTEDVSKLTITELSGRVNVSQPTIIRFVKAMGFNGYREFKDAIIMEIGNNKSKKQELLYGFELNKDDLIDNIPAKTIGTTIEILEETLKSISIDSFEEAVNMIIKAKRIDIYGVENSMSVVSDLVNKLIYLGLNIRYYTDNYMQNVCASNLDKDDLAIAISYSGTSKNTVDAIRNAKSCGSKTLVITNFEDTIINEYADVSIYSSNSKATIYGSAIFSRSSQIAIVDMLYMGVILSDYDKYSKILDKNSIISEDRSY